MEIRDVLVVLFYLWLLVALAVYGVRIYRKVTTKDDDTATATASDSPDATPSDRSKKATRASTSKSKPPSRLPSSIGVADVDDSRPPLAADLDKTVIDDGDLVRSVIRDELERNRAGTGDRADGDSADQGQQSGESGTTPSPRPPPDVPRPTIAEALAGIALPCDLAPTMTGTEATDVYRAVFATTGHSPRVINAEIADELERLGFAVRGEGTAGLVATRDGASVKVEIFDDAATARRDGVRLFPHVAGGSVAVVFGS